MAVELQQLRCFVTVADEGAIGAAASRLALDEPALAEAIRQLEGEVGAELIRNTGLGVEVTPVGRSLYTKACAAIAAAEDAVAAAQLTARRLAGELSVGFVQGLLQPIGSILSEFQERHPEITLRLKQLDFRGQLRELRAARIDAAVLCPPPRADDLAVVPLLESPMTVRLSTRHPLAGERELRFEQIADEPFPGRHPDVPEEWADFYWLTAVRGRRPPTTDETPLTPEETWGLIAAGKAISASPAFLTEQFNAPGVAVIPLVDVAPAQVALVHRAEAASPQLRALVATAAEHAVGAGA